MNVGGYHDIAALHHGARTTVLRARRPGDGRPVVLKQLREPFPSAPELARLRREYDLAGAAAGPGVIAVHGLFAREGAAWIEMEDFGGTSLGDLWARRRPKVAETLTLACRLLDALERVHGAGIVHKDVNPFNVVADAEGRTVKLIDFGIASAVPLQIFTRIDHLEGTPGYMSPEQTGRMNRALDWRSDYYSLGATLYHALVGAPPFVGTDPLEIVHAHIARRPVPPRELDPTIPEAVSDLVMTLLAKRADDRYQSAAGLRHDLERCLVELGGPSGGAPFPLRSADRAETLRIPDTLYGRAAEIAALDEVIARVASGAVEAFFVAGPAGAGKTSLIGEVHRGATAHRALFVSAKFEQLQRDQPHAAVLRALRQLLQRILGLPAAHVEALRARVGHALRDVGGVLVEALPELELLAGPQPRPPEVPPLDAEHRFQTTLARLVMALPDADRPAVLFFDDLQWADPASLALLERLLVEPALRRVLVLGAWRSNEVDDAHPLLRGLARAKELGARATVIELAPLTTDDVRALLADTLGRPREEVAALAQLAHAWTGGNPFLVHRVVEGLRDDGLLRKEGGRWTWELEELARRGLGEDAAGYVAGRLADLPPETRRCLEVASCIGTSFSASTLATVLDLPSRSVRTGLSPALSFRLVHPLQQEWWPDAADDVSFDFAFSHDRIQEAARARLDAMDAKKIHLRLGRLLLARKMAADAAPGAIARDDRDPRDAAVEPRSGLLGTPAGAPEATVFEIVHHLNLAVDLLSAEERATLCRLDAEAGRRAIRSGAFAPAHQLLEQALALLEPDAWDADPATARAFTLDAARAASLAGASDRMEAHVTAALARATTPLDRVAAREIEALDRAGRDPLAAVDLALVAMRELGVALPRRPAMRDVEVAMGAAMGALAARGPEGIVAVAELHDPTATAVIRLANAIMAPAYIGVPRLLPILAAEIVGQTAARGVTPEAAYGYAILALVLTAGGALEPGYQVAQLCLRLMASFPDRGNDARPGHVLLGHVLPHTLPLREAVERHRAFLPRALASGDHEYAMWIAHLSLVNAFYAGVALDTMAVDLERETSAMRRLGQRAPLDCTEPLRRHVRALRGQTPRADRMDEEGYAEEAELRALVASGSRGAVHVFQTQRLLLRFVFRDLEGALAAADAGEPYADGVSGTYHLRVFHQALALVCVALAGTAPSGDARAALLARARANRALLEGPAAHAPHNHRHRLLLIDAELARVEGDTGAALEGYDAAIEAARANDFLHDEALANELAGRFHLARRRLTPARAYLLEACGAWARWGATAKLHHLEAELPEVIARTGTGIMRPVTADVRDAELDLATLSKATLAITSELHTDRLVSRVLAVSVENAGATRGLLLLERDGALRLEAARGEGLPPRGAALGQIAGVPLSVLQYVARTGARLVLADARLDPRFASDPCLSADRPLSVLALPLQVQGRATGLIYLENDLTPDAFPPARIELQELLGAQAAISLESARLYDELEESNRTLELRVDARTRELSDKNAELAGALQKVQDTQRQLVMQEKLASLGALTAGIAHELKNPLNFVTNFAELSVGLAGELDESLAAHQAEIGLVARQSLAETLGVLRDNVGRVAHHGRRASGILSNMLLHARETTAARETTDLNAVLVASVELAYQAFRRTAPEFHARIELRCDPSLSPLLLAAQDLSRVFINLVSNACYAMRQKSRVAGPEFRPTLEIGTEDRGSVVVVKVRDNGTGIAADVVDKIFDPFFTTKPSGEGTGLGLSIGHDVVRGHGGQMSVTTEPGAFTELTITLPREVEET